MIIESDNRPLNKEKRRELAAKPLAQIDMQGQITEKNDKRYFGYKRHIEMTENKKTSA